MRQVAVTGIGCVTGAGVGVQSLREALACRSFIGVEEEVETLRGRRTPMLISRTGSFDREEYLPPRRLRRMSEASQLWVIACLLARTDAGLAGTDASGPLHPDKCGIFAGTGFGSTDVTWDYLQGMLEDGPGMANPFLFSESVANAPAGHAGIDLDLRGTNVTVTCADASAASALDLAARAIRSGRLDAAWCGGFEILSPPLLRVLATLNSTPKDSAPRHLGEGSVCFVVEALDIARKRGARIYAELAGSGLASDPLTGPTEWSREIEPHRRAMQHAIHQAGGQEDSPVILGRMVASGSPAGRIVSRAASSLGLDAPEETTGPVLGQFTAAGGADLAAAILAAAEQKEGSHVMANASSWGGTIVTHLLKPVRGN